MPGKTCSVHGRAQHTSLHQLMPELTSHDVRMCVGISPCLAAFQQQQQTTQQLANAVAAAAIKMDSDANYEDLVDETTKAGEEDPARPKWMKKRKEPACKCKVHNNNNNK